MVMKAVLFRLALLVAALTAFWVPAFAHDIPSDITVQAFVKPEGQSLRVLLRLPLKSVMDIEFPRKEREFVDIARAGQSLRDAAKAALADNLEIYEGDVLLPAPTIVTARMSLDGDKSFASYDEALAHIKGPPLPEDTSIFWEQGILDAEFEYPIQSERSYFSIHVAFDKF
jgi:hypothetical protein